MQKEVKELESSLNGKNKPAEALRYIEVDEKDIEIGNALAVEILGRTLDELSIPARDLLELIDKMLEEKLRELRESQPEREATLFKRDLTFTRRELREYTGWTNTRLHNHIKELVSMEYIVMENARINNMQTYKLIYDGRGKDGEKFIL